VDTSGHPSVFISHYNVHGIKLVRPLSNVDNTRDYARVSHSRQWYNYNVNLGGLAGCPLDSQSSVSCILSIVTKIQNGGPLCDKPKWPQHCDGLSIVIEKYRHATKIHVGLSKSSNKTTNIYA